jgi:hypothetical protein
VERHEDSVRRHVDIGLEVPISQVDGVLKGHERVLRNVAGTAAVSER